jgi:DNA-binding FadR family transcriptional regulator
VREAIKALSLQGLVEATPGRGTFINKPPLETAIYNIHLILSVEDHSFDDLMVVRKLLEVPIARSAAEQAQPSNIEALAEHLQGMRSSLGDNEAFIYHDTAFHAELASATQNVVLTILLQTIVKMLQGAREMLVRVPEAAGRALGYHEKLYRAVAGRDPSAAEQGMRDHLAQVADDLRRARELGLHDRA